MNRTPSLQNRAMLFRKLMVVATDLRYRLVRAILRVKLAVDALRPRRFVHFLREGATIFRSNVVVACVPRQRLEPSLEPVQEFNDRFHHNVLTLPQSLDLCCCWSSACELGTHTRNLFGLVFLSVALGFSVPGALAADSSDVPQNVFAAALIDGYSSAPVPQRAGPMSRVLEALQAQSGSAEPISIVATRVVRFTQQSRCGRIRFAVAQPLAKKVWPAIGGEMNVCEDGQPPLKTCPERLGVLVQANAVCPSGRPPVDTEEVAEAIAAAVRAGAITHVQMMRDWNQRINAHAQKPLTHGASASLTPSAPSPALPSPSGASK